MVGAFTATAFKSTGILAVGVCLLLVAVTARAWHRSSWQAGARQWLSALSALVVGGAAPVVLWTLLTPLFALDVPPSPMSRFDVSSLGRDQVLGNLLALAPPTQSAYLAPALRTTLVMALIGLGGYLVLGAVAAVSLSRTGEPMVDRLGGCTLVAMLVGGPLLVLLTYVVAGAYVPIPPRYGLVLLPPAIAVLSVLATRHRVTFVVATAIGVAQLVAYTQAIA